MKSFKLSIKFFSVFLLGVMLMSAPLQAEKHETKEPRKKTKSDNTVKDLTPRQYEERRLEREGAEESGGIGVQSVSSRARSASSSSGIKSTHSEVNDHIIPDPKAVQFSEINLAQGTLKFTEADLSIPGLNGLDLIISRSYNSQNYRSVPNLNREPFYPSGTRVNPPYGRYQKVGGAGMAVGDLNGDEIADAIEFKIDHTDGKGYYRVGWDFGKSFSKPLWSKHIKMPYDLKYDEIFADIDIGDINGNGTPDVLFYFMTDFHAGNWRYYAIGWDMKENGEPRKWSEIMYAPEKAGMSSDGAGVSLVDVDRNGQLDLVALYLDDPRGENKAKYEVGFNLDEQGKAESWSKRYTIPGWFGHYSAGISVTSGDLDQNGVQDLIVYHFDDKQGENTAHYRIGWNVNKSGKVKKWERKLHQDYWMGDNTSDISCDYFEIDGKPYVLKHHYLGNDQGHSDPRGYYHLFKLKKDGEQFYTLKDNWGAYAGHGWSFNIGMRAFAVLRERDDNRDNKVVIERDGGMETYEYNASEKAYLSTSPGNFNKVFVTREQEVVDGKTHPHEKIVTEIVLQLTNGQKIIFKTPYMEEKHVEFSGNHNVYDYELHVTGLLVSEIKDLYDNTISFTYQPPTGHPDELTYMPSGTLTGIIGGQPYEWAIDSDYSETILHPKHQLKEMRSVLGQTVNFTYRNNNPTPGVIFERNSDQLASIKYKNANGGTNTISYGYDFEGKLSSVQLNDHPKKYYTYKKMDIDAPAGDAWRWSDYEHLYQLQDRMEGYLLNKITTPTGVQINYDYSDQPNYMTWDSRMVTNLSFPLVLKKTILKDSSSTPLVYDFQYPKNGNRYHKGYDWSQFSDDKVRLYFYSPVKVVTPPEEEDEVHTFSHNLPAIIQKGDHKTVNIWEKKHMRKKATLSYFKDELRSFQFIEKYDDKNNVLSVATDVDFKVKLSQKKVVRENSIGHKYDAWITNPINARSALKDLENALTSANFKISFHPPITRSTKTYAKSNALKKNNLHHLVEKSIVTEYKNNQEKSTRSTYNSKGKPLKIYQEDILRKTVAYDKHGRISKETVTGVDNQKLSLKYTYNSSNLESRSFYKETKTFKNKKTITWRNPHTLQPYKTQDANGNISEIERDSLGRTTMVEYPNGLKKTFSYPNFNTSKTTQAGLTSTIYKDNFGRVLYVDNPNGTLDEKREYYYGGKVKAIYQGSYPNDWEEKVRYEYDAQLRPFKKISKDFGTTTTTFDDENRKVTVTDPLGRKSVSIKNKLGQLEKTEFYAPNESTPESTVTHKYDGFGKRIQTVDGRGIARKVDYDGFGRVINTYHSNDDENSFQQKSSISYYPNNKQKESKLYDEDGTLSKTINYDYDNEDRITALKIDGQEKESYVYDNTENGLGALGEAKNDWVKTKFDYDNMGQLKTIEKTVKLPTMSQEKTYTSLMSYDDEKGLYKSFEYKSPEGSSKYQVNYDYNDLNQLSAMTYYNKSIMHGIQYNPTGTVKTMTLGNGVKIDYMYERDQLITNIKASDTDGRIIYEQSYQYDPLARITQTTYTNLFTSGTATRRYTYTAEDELQNVNVFLGDPSDKDTSSFTYTYHYDSGGNRTLFQNPAEPEVKNPNHIINTKNDQLVTRTFDKGKSNYSYDGEGNMTKRLDIDNSGKTLQDITYNFNYQGSLSEVKLGDWSFARYYYDTERQRVGVIREEENGNKETQLFHWDESGQIIGQGTENDTFNIRYFYNGNEKIGMLRKSSDNLSGSAEDNLHHYYFINNLQGTPVAILNEDGVIVQQAVLDEYGNIERVLGEFGEEINYTGKRRDYETGMFYFNQRYYHPEIGRFISEDPASQFLNPYIYGANNPLMYVDPDGQWVNFVITILAEAAKQAAIEAAKAALTNITIQWVANDFNSSKINWDSVGKSALGAGIMGGLGINNLKPFDEDNPMGRIGNDMIQGGMHGMIGASVSGEHMSFDHAFDTFMRSAATSGAVSILREVHYSRNALNDPSKATELDTKDNMHKYNLGENEIAKKYTSKFGFHERVDIVDKITGKIKRTTIENIGTFNFLPSWTLVGHGAVDMLPYFFWGNGYSDSTTIGDRMNALF